MVARRRLRTVLITGGTGSVGKALIEAFAASGYEVTFQFSQKRTTATRLAKRIGVNAIQIDFTRDFTLPKNDFDVVVNNAGINISDVQSHEVSLDDWNRTLRVNLTAAFLLVQQCLPAMLKKGRGCIINISSIYGLRGVEGRLPYTVSKHGMAGLTKTLAKEYGGQGITCNEICPGPIDSTMMKEIAKRSTVSAGRSVKSYFKEVCDEIPVGRMVKPSEVAALAVFLASDEAAYLNGASITLDGGMIA
jgi:3-hydroxybutyrate dehydrogenase